MVLRIISGGTLPPTQPRASETAHILEMMTMSDSKLFASDPRDFALELVENGLVTAAHLLLCALKYMSTDDVRDMLDANELSPRFDEDEEDSEADEDELEAWIAQFDSDEYDVEAMKTDIATNNLQIGRDDHTDKYRHENIIAESITNGNFTQAKEQCTRYGYDYDEMRRIYG
jgi:hypothetical protein